ncbi:MAG: cytidine deaminase [Candidatus Pacebacteria bacterium]|nr:cytidine deaminase [Candidatus Paceibacterota bacterium]
MKKTSYHHLNRIQAELLDKAEKAMKMSYCPYSGFSVGAAVLTKNHEIVAGANVENAAYGSTICAERAALVSANAKGHQRDVIKIAVIAKGKNHPSSEITAPCGSCRQMIFESARISGCDIEIIMSDPEKENVMISAISELLPLAFGPNSLKSPS